MDAGSFGAFIAGCRRKSGMTQAQLAVKLNVTDKAVSRWERGIGFPDISTIEPLASALGMSVQDLMKPNRQGNEEHGFCMVEMPYFEPFKTYPASTDIDSMPAHIQEHVRTNGYLWVVKELETDVAAAVSKDGTDSILIPKSKVVARTKRARFDVLAAMPEEMQEHERQGGYTYSTYYPENGKIRISTNKELNGCSVTVDSYSWAEYYGDLSHHELAVDMHECIVMIRKAKGDVQLNAASRLRGHLVYCTTLTDLDELTALYKDKEEDNVIGYNPPAVADFVGKMLDKYPKSDSINERSLTHWHRIYAETGAVMADCLVTMRDFENEPDNAEHKSAAELLHMHLDRCLDWNGIANLTLLYYDKAEGSVVGYNMDAVTEFVSSLTGMYPMPDK